MPRLRLVLFLACLGCCAALAQPEPPRVAQLEDRVSKLELKVRQLGDEGLLLFLFATVCALWAQNTGRNAWLWFFLGLFFSVITVLVLLWKNSHDRQAPPGKRTFNLQDFRQQ